MQKKKFYRFKEAGFLGLETCDILTEDFVDKWGNLDESAVKLDKTHDLTKLEETEQELNVLEVEEDVFESYEDRVHTLEVALRTIATGETRDKRFKGKSVSEICTEALAISKRLEIVD